MSLVDALVSLASERSPAVPTRAALAAFVEGALALCALAGQCSPALAPAGVPPRTWSAWAEDAQLAPPPPRDSRPRDARPQGPKRSSRTQRLYSAVAAARAQPEMERRLREVAPEAALAAALVPSLAAPGSLLPVLGMRRQPKRKRGNPESVMVHALQRENASLQRPGTRVIW